MTKELDLFNGYTPALPDQAQIGEVFKRIADFQVKANKKPDPKFQEKTPDGKADALVISYVENRLDELYSGLWSTTNFRMHQVANEIVGIITLKVFHPSCGVWLEREGTAAINVMMDACPAGEDRNSWALDLAHKKSNALKLNMPTLKAEATKNAAKSLGVTFGRELNRKKSDTEYNPDVYSDDSIIVREEIIALCATSKLPETELQIMAKFAQDATTGLTRLMSIKERLTQNQK